MIRTLLATTALVTLVSTGAFAQDTTAPAPVAPSAPMTQGATPAAPAVIPADGHLASNLIGETVYNGSGENAENIGDVNDIVIGADGKVEAVIVGVGGFLGIGEKNVAVDFTTVDWAEGNGDRWLVVAETKESLEAKPAFDAAPYNVAPAVAADQNAPAQTNNTTAMAPAPAAPAPDASGNTTAMAPAPDASGNTTAMAPAPADQNASATDSTQTAAIDRSTLTEIPAGELRSEELVGTTVYGADDANVGEIGDVILTTDGKADAVIIDVGGFLGIGEKEVAVGMDNLSFMTDQNGNKYLYTNFTKEQLDAAAAYDESTWAEKRDSQRLTITQ